MAQDGFKTGDVTADKGWRTCCVSDCVVMLGCQRLMCLDVEQCGGVARAVELV